LKISEQSYRDSKSVIENKDTEISVLKNNFIQKEKENDKNIKELNKSHVKKVTAVKEAQSK